MRAIVGQRFADRFPELIPYRQYLPRSASTVTIFAAILCPELLCPDRRDNVLSLYLSTAVGRLTYVAGKLLAALVPLLCLTLAARAAAVRRQHVLRRLGARLPRATTGATSSASSPPACCSPLYFSLVGLAVASFTSRRAFALGGYAALMLIPTLRRRRARLRRRSSTGTCS